MPVFYTPIPQNLRVGLAQASSAVFINNRTRDSGYLHKHGVENEGEVECYSSALHHSSYVYQVLDLSTRILCVFDSGKS